MLLDLRASLPESSSVISLVRNVLRGGSVEIPDDVIEFMLRRGSFLLLVDSVNEARIDDVKKTFQPFLTQ